MIMPCMNSTSAGDHRGGAAVVDAGNFLLGLPGAPRCTTAGGAGYVWRACAMEEERPVAAMAARSMPNSTAPLVERMSRRKERPFNFEAQLNIFSSSLKSTGSGNARRRNGAAHTMLTL